MYCKRRFLCRKHCPPSSSSNRLKLIGRSLIFVINEHGAVEGPVTLHDIMGAVVGDLPSVDESDEPPSVQREDGSWLVDGALPIDELQDIFHLDKLPGEGSGNFHAVERFRNDAHGPHTGNRRLLRPGWFAIRDPGHGRAPNRQNISATIVTCR
jgi:hypothetical protein